MKRMALMMLLAMLAIGATGCDEGSSDKTSLPDGVEMVDVIRITRELRPGDRLRPFHIEKAIIYKDEGGSYKCFVPYHESDFLVQAKGKPVYERVHHGQLLMVSHITPQFDSGSPFAPGKVGYMIPMEIMDKLPSDGQYVNLVGVFQNPTTKEYEAVRIIEAVRVLKFNKHGGARGVMVEVAPDIALKLVNLKMHCRGGFQLEIINSSSVSSRRTPTINRKLDPLTGPTEVPPASTEKDSNWNDDDDEEELDLLPE